MSNYYSLHNAITKAQEVKAQYIMVFGERSNGKTYACKTLGLNGDKELDIKGYIQNGSQFAIVRRWQDDFRSGRAQSLFNDLVNDGLIAKWTKGKWDQVYYRQNAWYLAKYDAELDKVVHDAEPFAYAFALSSMEHDKSTSYPKIDKIFFDEFLTRGRYLPDEFVLFSNCLSTIIRDRNNVTVYLMGNTVNQYCPYFAEMGLTNVKKMQPGDIDVYSYGKSNLHVIVEYADTSKKKKKKSDVYFAFNNPRLKMITGGDWELDIYPHAPAKIVPKDVKFKYFIIFGGETLQCDVVCQGVKLYTYVHRKTTPIKEPDRDLVFSVEYKPLPNWKRRLTKPTTKLERKLLWFFENDRTYYQDNEVGELVRNYLIWSKNESLTA